MNNLEVTEIYKQKQIEEMSNLILTTSEDYYKTKCCEECADFEAIALFESGYVKKSYAYAEFAEKLKFMMTDSRENAIFGFNKYGKDSLVGMNYAGEAFRMDKVLFAIDFIVSQCDIKEKNK